MPAEIGEVSRLVLARAGCDRYRDGDGRVLQRRHPARAVGDVRLRVQHGRPEAAPSPPQKGRKHILRIIRELLDFKPENTETNLVEPLRYLTNAIKKRCTAFVISDFIDEGYENALTIANKKHDVVALKIYDPREQEIPAMGWVKMKDAETGKYSWIDTSSKRVREDYKKWWSTLEKEQIEIFKKSGVDYVGFRTDQDYVKPLIQLFKQR